MKIVTLASGLALAAALSAAPMVSKAQAHAGVGFSGPGFSFSIGPRHYRDRHHYPRYGYRYHRDRYAYPRYRYRYYDPYYGYSRYRPYYGGGYH